MRYDTVRYEKSETRARQKGKEGLVQDLARHHTEAQTEKGTA